MDGKLLAIHPDSVSDERDDFAAASRDRSDRGPSAPRHAIEPYRRARREGPDRRLVRAEQRLRI